MVKGIMDKIDLPDIPVMRVRADMKGSGPAAAFDMLESKLPTLKGRKFYGTFRILPDGEEYYACVARVEADDPGRMGFEEGVIPGGRYLRHKVMDWEQVIREGKLPGLVDDLVRTIDLDPGRPTVEFYRSHEELHLLVPVRG